MGNVDSTDVIIVGSGVAGLSAALAAAENSDAVVLTKGKATDCCTQFSQGGVAVALSPLDSPELHMEDTLAAGAGLCEPEAVR
ncbi:MAG: FAD-binding protein, partial [Armatimonadetes bacterium]|nr:FAD-binding protein [Armatimonadota bacterium]